MSISLKPAQASDASKLRDFLQQVNLPSSDLPADLSGFTLAFEGEKLVGSAGMELLGNIGLLRSVAVAETHRNHALGRQLFASALDHARAHDAQEVYLITNSAERYFEKNGFQAIERNEAPEQIVQTEQFSGLCPSSSFVMKIKLR